MEDGGVSEPYRLIKNLQQAIRKPNGRESTLEDMLVLSQQNDPFYAGNGVEGEKTRWFARLWRAVVMVLPRADLRSLDHDLRLALDRVSFAQTLGVEQSELISRLDTLAA